MSPNHSTDTLLFCYEIVFGFNMCATSLSSECVYIYVHVHTLTFVNSVDPGAIAIHV